MLPSAAKRPTTTTAIIGLKLSNTARRTILLGSLSYSMRGNLSVFTMVIIYAITRYIKNILALERFIPR
jgi:hypothetical protein